MSFAVGLELFVSDAWADITPDLSDDGVTITRGRSNEGAQVDPARMSCRLRNNDGRYSPRNPRSPLFGLIGRNTPIRFWEETGQARLVQDAGTQWYTADSAGLSITGDIDLRVDIAPRTWRPETSTFLGLIKGSAYWLSLGTTGVVTLGWYDGTDTNGLSSSVPAPGGITGRKAIRATLDVDNGAGVAAATFYTSDSLTGTWVQLGAVVEHDDTTQIDDSTESLGTYIGIPAEVFGIEVREGIGGTVRASVDWTSLESGVVTHDDAQSNTWEPAGSAVVTNRHYRFVGEVTAWPQRWGKKGASTVHAPIECAGVLRRIGQGNSPVQSVMRRGCESLSNLVGYWPFEDAEGARSLQVVTGAQAAQLIGEVDVAAFAGFDATDHLPTLGTGRIYCAVSPYAESGEVQVRWLSSAPDAGVTTDEAVVLRVRTGSSLGWADVHYKTDGGWYVTLYNNLGALSHTTAVLGSSFNGQDVRLSLELKQDGADVDITLVSLEAGQSEGFTLGETDTGITLGRITSVEFNPAGADVGSLAVGHVTVEKGITSIFDLATQFAAYAGERADTRMLRLADENSLSLAVIGAGAGCERMGPQRINDLTTLLREAATSDGGALFEPRVDNALRYRSLESLWTQDPAVTIAYTDNLLLPFEPVDDDEGTRNKVTVTRAGGGSYTVEDSTGPLGTQNPPDGVGIYDEGVTLSLATDAAAEQQAGWRLHLGTVDEARWPQIGLDLAHPTFVADEALTRQILTLDVGDRLDVEGLPAWLPPYPVRQIIQGYSETITPPDPDERGRSSADPAFHHRIVFNCTPARPYNVGTYVASGYESETELVPTTPTVYAEDDFTGTNGDALSATWTTGSTGSGHTAAIQGNRGRFTTGSSSLISRRVNGVSQADGVITFSYWVSGNSFFNFLIRHGTTTLDRNTCYAVKLPTPNDGNIQTAEITGYSGSFSGAAFAVSAATQYHVKIVVAGSSIEASIWEDGDPEPGSPQATLTDSTITAAGYWGFYVGGTSAGAYVEIDDFEWADSEPGFTPETTITPIDAGPSNTRYASGGSELDAALLVDATAADVLVTEGPEWTTAAGDFPLDLLIGGEQVTCTAVGAASSGVQEFTLTRAVNGIAKEHAAGTSVELLDPVFWGARPLGGTLFTGGGDTGGGGSDPDPQIPNTVRIGTATYPLSGVDPGTVGGWGGDPAYSGDRGVDQLIVYTAAYGAATDTNQWGLECVVADSDDLVDSANDRQASQSLTGTTIGAGNYVLSGHSLARQWLLANAGVGAGPVELIYLTAGGGGTGGGTGGGGSGGGTIGAYPTNSVVLYKKIFSGDSAVTAIPTNCTEIRLSFAQGAPPALVGGTTAGTSAMVATLAARRAAGTRIVVSVGGAGGSISTSNRSQFLAGIASIKAVLEGSAGGGLDGIDWDIETGSSFPTADAVFISTQLKSLYGAGFAITMAPNGSNVGAYLPAAVQLHQANALDHYGQQFYDSVVSLSAAKGRISEAINAGLPASKIGVGMALTSPVSNGFWGQSTAITNMTDIKNSYGVTKCYLWVEDATYSNGQAQTWVNNMRTVLGI